MNEQQQRGFTLVELMVSLVLFSLAVAGIMSVAVSMTIGLRTQRQVVAAEVAARAPIDYLSDAIRGSSPGVATGNITDIETCRNGAIKITDSTTGPDKLEIVYASGGVKTWTTPTFSFTQTSTTIDVVDGSQIAPGDYVVVVNQAYDQGHLARVTAVTPSGTPPQATLTIAPTTCGATFTTYGPNSLVVRAQRAEFSVANDADGIPTLYMDPDGPAGSRTAEPLAEGVEDFQVAIGIDGNNDSTLAELPNAAANDDEWTGDYAGDTLPATWTTPPPFPNKIRAVRITLVARTILPLPGSALTFNRPAAENHPGDPPNTDAYRRRVLKSTIEIRNLGGSP